MMKLSVNKEAAFVEENINDQKIQEHRIKLFSVIKVEIHKRAVITN